MAAVAEPIKSKAMMYRLMADGRFGNYPRAWSTVEEVERSGFDGLVSIRSLERSSSLRMYHIPAKKLRGTVISIPDQLLSRGVTFCEAPPDDKRTIQGEWDGENLFYSFDQTPMRTALEKDGKHVRGLEARMLLQRHLDPSDLDWLDALVEQYPDHVIEFSGFRVRCGTLSKRMIVWEVRAY